jgi:hypothetical protein
VAWGTLEKWSRPSTMKKKGEAMFKMLSSSKQRIRRWRRKRIQINTGTGMFIRRLMWARRRMMMSFSMRNLRDTRGRTITKKKSKVMIKS